MPLKKLVTTRFITFPAFMRSSVILIAFSETLHCFANVEILMRVFCYKESILLCPYCAPVMPLSCPCHALTGRLLVSFGRNVSFLPLLKNLHTNNCFHDKGNEMVLRFFNTQCRQLTTQEL